MDNKTRYINIAKVSAGIMTALGLVFGILKFDDRYVKVSDLQTELNYHYEKSVVEIAKNRKALTASLLRSADDLDYEISEIENSGKSIPRYMIEKRTQFNRDIEELTSK